MLKNIFNNPGLQHIAETIFCNLSYEDLEACRIVNQSCKQVLDDPMLWLKKFIRRGLSIKNQLDWRKAIQLTKYTNLEENVLLYLKKSSKNKRVVNLPCYINEKIVKNSKKLIKKYHKPFVNREYDEWFNACMDGNAGIFQILATLMPNPNALDKNGFTPIEMAVDVRDGYEPIVQILAPLTENPNTYDKITRMTPILSAARHGYPEMIRILAPLTDNPNKPGMDGGLTPIHAAAARGDLEVVKLLAPFINDFNATYDETGWTAMHVAALKGKIEVIKFLAPLTDELNSQSGDTPIDLARKKGHHEVVKYLESYQKPAKRARLK